MEMTNEANCSIALAALALAGVVWADSALLINGAGATFLTHILKVVRRISQDKCAAQNKLSVGRLCAGIKQVTEGTVDFGATDGPMNDDQLKAYKDKHGSAILHFPTVLGAVVPTYNIPGVTLRLISPPTRWSASFWDAFQMERPGHRQCQQRCEPPANDIVVIHRSDGSGTTYIWTTIFPKSARTGRTKLARAPR